MKVAHLIEVSLCANPKCRAVHIYLCDEDETRFAVGAIKQEDIAGFIQELSDLAYAVAATKDN
jgi:hypothetical protein